MKSNCPHCGAAVKATFPKFGEMKLESLEEAPPLVDTKKSSKDMLFLMRAYKMAKGYPGNDQDWNKRFFKIYARAAKELLKVFDGNLSKAIDCLGDESEYLDKLGVDWNLHTIVKRVPEWLKREELKSANS